MSVTFPKNFAANDTVLAQDVRANLNAIRDKQQSINNVDIRTNQTWVDTHHIMQGRYSTTTNLSINVSGVFGGKSNGSFFENMSYCSRWISNRTSTTDGQRTFIPMSNITFDIIRPCTIVFQWSMIHQSASDSNGSTGKTQVRPSLNGKTFTGGFSDHIAMEQPNGTPFTNVLINGTRITNGIVVKTIPSQILNYNIGLTGQSTAGKCQNVSWSVSLECFYL